MTRIERPMWTIGTRDEIRAGWIDARRTPRAVPWHGKRWGDVAYALGYALGALS